MSLTAALKTQLRKSPALVRWKAFFNATRYTRTYFDRDLNWWQRVLHKPDIDIIQALPLFVPLAQGRCADVARLTLLAARQTFPLLQSVLAREGLLPVRFPSAEEFCREHQAFAAANLLRDYFNDFGSDKSQNHDYHFVYGPLMAEPRAISAMLEIGLGTNHPDIVSTMGAAGQPGASLRAFRKYLPAAQLFGADVDRRILFQEDRIRCFFVDQTDPVTFAELDRNTPPLDLIIDDGLHSPNANLTVLLFALEKLKKGGTLVIEDIKEDALPVWQVVSALLNRSCRCTPVRAKGALMFLVQKL